MCAADPRSRKRQTAHRGRSFHNPGPIHRKFGVKQRASMQRRVKAVIGGTTAGYVRAQQHSGTSIQTTAARITITVQIMSSRWAQDSPGSVLARLMMISTQRLEAVPQPRSVQSRSLTGDLEEQVKKIVDNQYGRRWPVLRQFPQGTWEVHGVRQALRGLPQVPRRLDYNCKLRAQMARKSDWEEDGGRDASLCQGPR